MNITYGTHTIDTATIPEKSVLALLKRGVAHVLGNEVASKVTSAIRGEIGDDATKDQVKAFRESNADAVAKWAAEYQSEALAAITGGTLGDREMGPRGSSLDTVEREIAWAEIEAALAKQGLKFPKKAKGSTEAAKLAFGNGESLTKADLIARRLANPKFGPAIKKEAARRMKVAEQAAGAEEVF